MKINEAMSMLLPKNKPSGVSDNHEYTHFVEWDGCILISCFARDLPSRFDKKTYSDRTECETSINHLHLENLSIALGLIEVWEKTLRRNFLGKKSNIVVTCELDGKEAVARFYQPRPEEVAWVNEENDLESYKHEAILLLKVN
ncbi:hypothetical protein [Paenibacillus tianjinensis]|uniref:Uncharacterized protein n=1 Tax=Paenibacillus tianjinensis TaxID=2810347 RepID=A0ABX7LHB5_9BACL|nr:hypothetical protein [Paenibacillus tianjinensis]QSF46319.1 hypothetical protein JRJ22_06900 [Paenibacillus tianjinensis]